MANLKCELLCNFIEIALWHGCVTVNLLHIFRTPFPKNTSEGLLLLFASKTLICIFSIVKYLYEVKKLKIVFVNELLTLSVFASELLYVKIVVKIREHFFIFQ